MRNDPFLDAVAHVTARAIVDRHAGDRDALVEAIARLARAGLEGHVQQFESQQQRADG